ncbi:DUF5103 domain-containing protein [Bacteroidota bacterium]
MQKIGLLIVYFFLAIVSSIVSGQDVVFDEKGIAREMVLDENLKTIQLYREGWISSYPILILHENVPLILEFDELTTNVNNFSYQVFHCNADWTRSDLTEQDYMVGYFENQIDNFSSSFNTYYKYTHYKLSIPNENIRLTKSGNYLLMVYRNYDADTPVFTKRFMISEAAVTIDATAKRPVFTKFRNDSHEIDVNINHPGYRIDDPFNDTQLSIYQNGIWDYEISGLKPLFVNPDQLVYDYQEENIFMAGNEYRMFNTRNTQVREAHIQNIEYLDYFHFELKPDEVNPAHLYFDRDDLNGKFFIEAANTSDPALEADYTFVHFMLKMPFPLIDGDVYIAGASTNWQFTETNRMKYVSNESAYKGFLLLKQGNHNYRYIFLPNNNESFDISEIEGSHYETKNEYLILFYHRGQGDRYDKLAGHQIIHSY